MRSRVAGGIAAVGIAAVLGALAGCSSSPPETAAQTISLTGPWATEFQTAFANAKSVWERDVLRDGAVSASEYEQSRSHMRSCVGDAGYTITWDERGGFELGSKSEEYPDDFFDRSDRILQGCEAEWAGSIPFLFEQVRRNPDRKDEATIQVACLASAGLVDDTYSAQRWRRDNEQDAFPFDALSDAAVRCAADPLALWLKK